MAGEDRSSTTGAEWLSTHPMSEAAVHVFTVPASSRAGELLTAPTPSVMVLETPRPMPSPDPAALCPTTPMAMGWPLPTVAPPAPEAKPPRRALAVAWVAAIMAVLGATATFEAMHAPAHATAREPRAPETTAARAMTTSTLAKAKPTRVAPPRSKRAAQPATAVVHARAPHVVDKKH